jgi:hypothetical protein
MLRKTLLTAALVGAAFLATQAKAAVLTWDLSAPSGLLGDS